MFDSKSRYAKRTLVKVKDHRGRMVSVAPVPDPPIQQLLGFHVLRQGQRLDHLAQKYLDDPAGFWRICELNNVMQTEVLTETSEIAIPKKEK